MSMGGKPHGVARWLFVAVLWALLGSCSGPGNKPPADDPRSLAEQVLAGGAGAQAALEQALRLSGFAVRASGGGPVEPAEPAQGLVFEAWDLGAMLASLANGGSATLPDFAAALALGFPELEAPQLAATIAADLREAAQSPQPEKRFWAQFITELGRQAALPYDLLDPALDPTAVSLDPVQLGLIVYRLTADVWLFVQPSSGGARLPAPKTASQPPCTLTETQALILDAAAAASSIGFGQMLDYLSGKGLKGAEKYAKVVAWVNAALSAVKLVWSWAAFKGEISMDGPELVRTKSAAADGELRKVTAKFRLDLGNAQMVNCLRILFNGAGLDFSLWNDGPIKNAGVDWLILQGGTTSRGLGYIKFDEAEGNWPIDRRTDGEGKDVIAIEGVRQKRNLPADAERWDRPGKLHVKVSLKTADVVQDLIDAAGGVLSLPAEMAFRIGFGFAYTFSFNVVDWKDPCEPGVSRAVGAQAEVCGVLVHATASFNWAGHLIQTAGIIADVQDRFEADLWLSPVPGGQGSSVSGIQNAPSTEANPRLGEDLEHGVCSFQLGGDYEHLTLDSWRFFGATEKDYYFELTGIASVPPATLYIRSDNNCIPYTDPGYTGRSGISFVVDLSRLQKLGDTYTFSDPSRWEFRFERR